MTKKKSREEVLKNRKRIAMSGFLSVLVGLVTYIIYANIIPTGVGVALGFAVVFFSSKFIEELKKASKIKKIEDRC